MEFVEFAISEDGTEMNLYVKTSDGSFYHVRDYDCYYEDYDFTIEQGMIVEVYSYHGVSYAIHNGRLFELTFNKGIGAETEVTLPMLLAHNN